MSRRGTALHAGWRYRVQRAPGRPRRLQKIRAGLFRVASKNSSSFASRCSRFPADTSMANTFARIGSHRRRLDRTASDDLRPVSFSPSVSVLQNVNNIADKLNISVPAVISAQCRFYGAIAAGKGSGCSLRGRTCDEETCLKSRFPSFHRRLFGERAGEVCGR
jgi:hypothetical protein